MKKKFLGIICIIYSLLIIDIWLSGRLDHYIAPNMQIYLKISIIPMLLMSIVIFVNKFHYKYKVSDLVLLLPFIMLFLAGDGNLSMSLASNKIGNFRNSKSKNEEIIEVGYEDEYDFSNPYFNVIDPSYSYLANYITYMSGAKKFVGKTIKVRGFVVDYSDYLNDGYYALGKYSITCCAADAEFAGFMIKTDEKVKLDDWYEVEGVLEQAKDKEGYNIMVINVKNIVKIHSSSEDQYVYSCESYTNGCAEVLKYDFEY